MKRGHGITGAHLQKLCAEGKFKPLGDCVLVEALMEEDAHDNAALARIAGVANAAKAGDGVDLTAGVTIDARKAVAFRVAAIGPIVPTSWGVEVDDVVMNISISGERVDASDKACPWWSVRADHLVGLMKAKDAYAEGYSPAGPITPSQAVPQRAESVEQPAATLT